jgi:hypothetical protein
VSRGQALEEYSIMNPVRFDSIAKFLASRRLSRRQALAQGGVGMAADALAARTAR